ncbi:MAG: hypothetical protein FJ186_03535 [Gammaproteobacteria bacterium]|nr:hypothetical protein [Gammaproteobacteria bacterium]
MKKVLYTLLIPSILLTMVYLLDTEATAIIDLSNAPVGHYLVLESHKPNCEKFIDHPQKEQEGFLLVGPYDSHFESFKAYSKLQNCAKTIHIIAKNIRI